MKGKIQLKKLIIDIIIVIACIGILIGVFAFYKYKTKSSDYDENEIAGKIHVIVIYENEETVIDEYLEFSDGETIFKILERHHTLVYQDDLGVGKGILEIDEYKSDWYHSYFMLYVDNKYATEGTELIKASDNMEIKLLWKAIN